ncbi:glycoside hydrolase family 3 N-terminal domain-containing protein [Kallotenue papyrolyticum]|uniref:glycoside hydrolase family 3 N-terminal domain-containing protein n=1 Tax=Kallotenue papyrolyticum TaxID=1325125 RepID=UPI0004924B8F|nr:glycoside hydrolase family 3 N-terminal domain-containing protein [Kallotenue papyrolyticum]
MASDQPRYKDPTQPLETRVEDLLSRMTLDEKIAQLGCLWSTALVPDGVFDADAVAAKMPHGIGQITRIGASTGLRPAESAALMNAIQEVALTRTRLGIPVIVHEESVGGFCHRDATVFPQALGLAATWDAALLEQVAGVIREQMLAVGARLALAPVLDVARDPRWGRVEETYGEDPVLAGTMGTAYVRGLQTDDLRRGVAATGKHFLGYAMSEGGRNWGPVQLGPRELREVYAEPFAAAIRDAGLAAIMNSYASVDGLPCAGSAAILTDLLRGELGFNGVVVADYWSIPQLLEFHRVAAHPGEAARLALSAGLDVELPALQFYGEPLKREIEAGRLPLEVLDTAVRRVLRLKFQLGLFEQPYVEAEAAGRVFQTPDQRALARRAVAESVVLLANDGVLPLGPQLKRVAVIGPGADDVRLLQGDYHYPAHLESIYLAPKPTGDGWQGGDTLTPHAGGAFAPGPYYTPHITPLAGLRAALGADVEVVYAKGCDVLGDDRSGFAEAVAAAQTADVAVVVVAGKSGLHRPVTVGEANDAMDLDLTGVQNELVAALAATGTPLVVVVLSGRVHTLERIAPHANALLYLFPPGEEGGHGLADVLTGRVAPSGRLPVTLPRKVGQVPIYAGHRAGGDRAMFFGDYSDGPPTPLFPFGHGLSYTSFAYEQLQVSSATTRDPITISLLVRNTGQRAGEEVVQLYLRDCVASVARPDRILAGFARVALEPGEASTVTFTVHPSRLAFFDPQMRFVVEPGSLWIGVGASSADIRLETTVELGGERVEYQQRAIVATQVAVERQPLLV